MSGRHVHTRHAPLAFALMLVVLFGAIWMAPAATADPKRALQWYLDAWKIEDAWKVSRGGGVTVAVIDSGVDATHPDLSGQVLPSLNTAGDDDGHGTGIASLIAGQGDNGQGVYGIAPGAKILPFRVPLNGDLRSTELVAQGIRAAADSPARIINLSLGSGTSSATQREAVAYALSKGKLLMAAAGNTPEAPLGVPIYPASYPGVVGISAVDQKGGAANNLVPGPWVSLSAPGADTPVACVAKSRYCIGTGSSSAAAITSGVAALVWSAHPGWTANQVIQRLMDSANRPNGGEEIPSNTFGWGSVSPRQALNSTAPLGPADVNPLVGKRGEAPPTTPAPSAAPKDATPQPNPATAGAPPAGTATADDSDDGSSLVPIAAGGAGAVVLIAAVTALIIRNRRRTRAEEEAASRAYASPAPQWTGGPQQPPYNNSGWPPYQG